MQIYEYEKNKYKRKMSKKIVNRITKILVFLILVQPVNAEESKLDKFNQKFSQKFSQIIQFLKNERKKTNDYQIKTWKEAKNENLKKIKIAQHKLTGFFSNFPEGK